MRPEIGISEKLDTASLLRGLAMIGDLGRISVEDIMDGRKVFVSRHASGPFVLEVTGEQFARGQGWLRASGRDMVAYGEGARLELGSEPVGAAELIVVALPALEGSATTTLVARYAPGAAQPWPD